MKKAHGLRRYFYESVYRSAVERARDQTGEVIPISQAKMIRARVDELLSTNGQSLSDPTLGVSDALRSIETALRESIPGYQNQFGDYSLSDPRYQQLQADFVAVTGVNATGPVSQAALPISPYDPQWSHRASVKRAGTQQLYILDSDITAATNGEVDGLASPSMGNVMLRRLDDEGNFVDAGQAMTVDDASGLTMLMDKMSEREFNQVRNWVADGGRDPKTGRINRERFMSPQAVHRSVAVLDELKAEGITYKVVRDRAPGQIKAVLADTGMEVRLIDTVNEAYAGARVYDNGTVIRFSTNHRVGGGMATYSPSPQEAVELLRFAQGKPVARHDNPGIMVGTAGSTHPETVRVGRNTKIVQVPDSYFVSRDSMFVVGDFTPPGGGNSSQPTPKVMLRREAATKTLPKFFVDSDAAETFLQEAVSTARDNVVQALDVEALIAHVDEQRALVGGDPDWMEPPTYAADPELAAIQRSYWEVLTGQRDNLLRPGATAEMYEERLASVGEGADEASLGNLVYSGTAVDKVRDHAGDVAYEMVGTFESQPHLIDGEWIDQRFDPGRVARYMTSATGQWSNLDDLAAACRRVGVSPSEMIGMSFQTSRFKDRLVRFDEQTATPLLGHHSPFLNRIGETVRDAMQRNATTVDELLIDHQGVISWRGNKVRRNGSTVEVSGELGQVFDVGSHGEIITQYASGENSLIVPGFEARIQAQRPGEASTSVEERTVLRGYEQLMHEQINYQIANDVMSNHSAVGEPASLNGVYSRIYGAQHPVDFIERATSYSTDLMTGEMTGTLDPWTQSIIETEARRVRYDNTIKQESTVYAEYRAQRDEVDPANDNFFSPWQLTGGRNMAVLTGTDIRGVEAPGGYFDPVMTSAGTNQGVVRFLTADARVDANGRITPGDPSTLTGSRAPLMTRPELETMSFDPTDRQQMTASTIMQSSEVTEPAGTALMTFGGWTADDPIVISKEFSAQHQIRGVGGRLRNLVVGDKLSDLHGNKGVVSLIVDRDMSVDDAVAAGIEREVAWFNQNPGLDVVMSPFSLISRRNAGAARELIDSVNAGGFETKLVDPENHNVTSGGIGQMRFVVTHMAVDEKTKIYDDEAILAGKGRKASSQLAWALQAQGCSAIMREFYNHNSGAESNLREYLLVSGLDMDADGRLRVVGTAPSLDERAERRFIEMPDLILTQPSRAGEQPGLNTRALRRSFGALIGDRGGDMELPFPLTYPTGEPLEAATATSWKLPVMSSYLRSGQEFDDGSSVTHDYTRAYENIFTEACIYRHAENQLADEGLSVEKREELKQKMGAATSAAQRWYESITNDLQARVFSGKNNYFKSGLMSSRLSDSATMVWTADPRLDIDQIALSSVKAEQLGLIDGDYALVWRDPVLRDSGVRYMRVVLDDNLTGAAINPVMDKCFDGDFDGDAVAVVKLHSQAAKSEAHAKLSVPANLLDLGVANEQGEHPLAMQIALDTKVSLSQRPELVDFLSSLSSDAQELAPQAGQDHSKLAIMAQAAEAERLTSELSEFYRDAQREQFGAALSFANISSHVQSVRDICVETGAKGNEKKLEDYARNLGNEQRQSGITQRDQEDAMFATAIKAHGTGLGGSFSQRAVRALRGPELKAVLEVTYPVTQSILQAKHDAAEARHKYDMLQGPGRDLWRGRMLDHVGPGQWKAVFDNGEAVQATTEQWSERFIEFYTAKDGFNVDINPAHVKAVAQALTDPKTGRIRNLEDDPSLTGTVMDRMAYGGDFQTLVKAAKQQENVFDGPNEQFASKATRRARVETQRQLLTSFDDVSLVQGLDSVMTKSDVLSVDEIGARTRGETRRSGLAVSVGQSRYAQQSEEDHEMGF